MAMIWPLWRHLGRWPGTTREGTREGLAEGLMKVGETENLEPATKIGVAYSRRMRPPRVMVLQWMALECAMIG